MAYNYNNDPFAPPGAEPNSPLPPPQRAGAPAPISPGPGESPSVSPAPVTSDNPQSAAFARFSSCRWQQPPEDGNAAFCTHREVKPYAGTAGFDADAWCPDCEHYKLRRAPKKRSPADDYTY